MVQRRTAQFGTIGRSYKCCDTCCLVETRKRSLAGSSIQLNKTIQLNKMSTNCLAGSQFDNSVASTVTRFEYWYGVETRSDDVESFRYDLEGAIYHTAIKSVVWCTDTGNRRIEEADGKSHFVDEEGRLLGIMAITSAPFDEPQLDSKCWYRVYCLC